jgi:hypothetical protein
MNLIEFSIACKLISLKLRNVEVPKLLPPTLIASLKHIGTPIRTPTGAMSPTEGYKQFITTPQNPPQQVASVPVIAQQQPPPQLQPQPQYQPQPILQSQPMMMHPQAQMMMNQVQQPQMMQAMGMQAIPQQQIPPEMIAQQQQMLMQQQQQIIQQQQQMMAQPQMMQMIPTGTVMPSQPPMMTNTIPASTAIVPPPSKPPLLDQLSNSSLLDSLAQSQPTVVASGPLPAAPTPTPPQSGHASRSMSFSEKAPSVPESP